MKTGGTRENYLLEEEAEGKLLAISGDLLVWSFNFEAERSGYLSFDFAFPPNSKKRNKNHNQFHKSEMTLTSIREAEINGGNQNELKTSISYAIPESNPINWFDLRDKRNTYQKIQTIVELSGDPPLFSCRFMERERWENIWPETEGIRREWEREWETSSLYYLI